MSSQSSAPVNTSFARTSNLLFGFLVSALSVFVIFMTVSILWNRLVARRLAIDAMLEVRPSLNQRQLLRPKIWDTRVVFHKHLPSWPDIKPVAAQKCDSCTNSPRPVEQTTVSLWRRIWNRLPPEITYLFQKPKPKASPLPSDAIRPIELTDGSDVQVSLLIAMPHAPQSTRPGEQAKERQSFPEIAFATTNVTVVLHGSS